MSITLETLKQFCSTDNHRAVISRPFSQDSWTYSTDGRVIIRVPRLDEVPEYDDSPKDCNAHFTDRNPITGDWFKIPADLPKSNECENCGGDGKHECACGDEHDCGWCGGTGLSPKGIPTKVGNQFASHLYLKQLTGLPNVEICNSAKSETLALGIRFDGGEGRLMPMKT